MAGAVFQISVGGGKELASLLGKLRETANREQKTIADGEKSMFTRMTKDHDSHVKAWVKEEKLKTQAKLRELAEQKKAEEKSAKDAAKAQRDATKIAAAEGRQRTNDAREEAREVEKLANAQLAARARAEREATRLAAQQERERTRNAVKEAAEREKGIAASRRGFGQVAGAIGTGLSSFASTMHGQIQDVRERRAVTERVLNSALFQAGARGDTSGGLQDAASLRSRVMQFAEANSMDSSELSAAINASQTEFSTLGNSRSSQAQRAANLEGMLQTGLFARNTGQDVGQVMRVQGMLANAGMDSGAQHSTMLALTGMAQRGAIELGSVSREAMAPIMRRVAHAREGIDPNDQGGLQSATQRAVLQSMAEMEVGRGLGITPRRLGNVTAGLEEVLRNPTKQNQMLTNIRNAAGLNAQRRSELENQFFARDSHGVSHLRGEFQDTFGLASGLVQAHVDSTTANTIFGGGGYGNPQSLKTNERQILGAFMGEGNEGVRKMMEGAGRDFTDADAHGGAGLFGNDAMSKLTAVRESHDNALSDNTDALVQLSDRLADAAGLNPKAAAGAKAISDGVSGLTGITGLLSKTPAGQSAAARAPGILSSATANSGGLSGALGAAGFTALAGHAVREGLLSAPDSRVRSIAQAASNEGAWSNQAMMSWLGQLGKTIHDAISGSTVTVSPHDAVHAATVASTRR